MPSSAEPHGSHQPRLVETLLYAARPNRDREVGIGIRAPGAGKRADSATGYHRSRDDLARLVLGLDGDVLGRGRQRAADVGGS